MKNKVTFGILMNETGDLTQNWINACKKYNYPYVLIDLVRENWLEKIKSANVNYCLLCPPGLQSHFKSLYDERVYIINKILLYGIYPNYEELIIHENKKFLSYFLNANNIPHPETYVFYRKVDALEFSKTCILPVVAKMNIGSSGSGVKVLNNQKELDYYINKAFSTGIRSKAGPNLKIGDYRKRILKIIIDPKYLKTRLKKYKAVFSDLQKGFLILQKYVNHDYEWRIVKIGESFFGHQKIKMGDKASGSKGINYILPPNMLLNFVRDICIAHNFNSMAIDCFEDGKGGFLVNEMQTSFGHVQNHICEEDGVPGRLKFQNNTWVFEAGNFNDNLSYNLRFENLLNLWNLPIDGSIL